MKSLYKFIVSPLNGRYDNTKDLGDGKKLILNTDISEHKFISREAEVLAIPTSFYTGIDVGDIVVVHHNVFRRWYDVRGIEKNSSNFIDEDKYGVYTDQIYMYKKPNGEWNGLGDFIFVRPVKNKQKYQLKSDHDLVGILHVGNKETDGMGLSVGDTIGFTMSSEYEFNIDDMLLYRMRASDICLKYPKGEYKVYNPSWM